MVAQVYFSASGKIKFAVSPFLEMGSYEALWCETPKATFKTIAERFSNNPGAMPSDFFTDEKKAVKYAEEVLSVIRESKAEPFGVRIAHTYDYPRQLRAAKYPVEFLYFRGQWDLVHTKSIAVVGTRHPSEEGIRRTQKLVRELVKQGFTIVSGLAEGIDTAAHTTALKEGGRTIAVIGTPIHEVYPKQNRELQEKIAREHLLISQVPVQLYKRQDYRLNRLFFPERNITMSALTLGTIIVEAGETSGTLIQAKAAFEQKRKLFILDNCFQNGSLTWPRKFEAKGAIRVVQMEDILSHLNGL